MVLLVNRRKAMEPDPKRYSMSIQRSDEDQAYIVTVPELPGGWTHGATCEEAIKQGQDAIERWITAALADNELVSAPRVAMPA
jgi:predicted RNase H-like HicB family nuclease